MFSVTETGPWVAVAMMLLSVSALSEEATQKYPDVLQVRVTQASGDRYRFDVTLSSPYDSPQRYADAFRVKSPAGETLGVRELLHDHASEQPFTRSLGNVEIPGDISEVVVEGRDRTWGYGGQTRTVPLPGR